MAVFTEKVYATQYSKKMYVDELNKYIYETGCAAFPEPRHIIYKINEHYHNRMGTYRCPAEQTSSGQDMSYWEKYRISVFEDYKRDALRNIIPHWIRIISNCKKLLVSDKYDMFEEFKRGYPHLSGYFDCKEFTWEIIGDSYHTNITTFIDCVVTCLLSKEAEDKQNEKIRKQQELRKKQEEERKLLLYKKEFECAKLFDEIDKNKLQSSELYVEYKKITEIKDKGALYNTDFINYFTEDKKKYIRVLIELVTNPKLVSNEGQLTMKQGEAEYDLGTFYLKRVDTFFQNRVGIETFFQIKNRVGWDGAVRDHAEAVRLYRIAAAKGHVSAQLGLGRIFKKANFFVKEDSVEAIRLFRLAAAQGNADAQYELAKVVYYGESVTQEDYAEAIQLYHIAAEQGNVDAQKELGTLFYHGDNGVTPDYVQAMRFYSLAAEQGEPYAQERLAWMFYAGKGVTKDYVQAEKWFRNAAEKGQPLAQNMLGRMFERGLGVTQDYAEAVRWYRLAANLGRTGAQLCLGRMYENGRGVEQNYAEAVRLYQLAANLGRGRGDAEAQFRLGRMFDEGRGVEQDKVEAMRLYRLAAAQGDKEAQSIIARYDPPLETAASSVATIDCPASVSPDCTIPPPPPYHHPDGSVIFDSKNDENLIIRVSECNADSSVIFDSNNDVVIGLSECNAINIVVPQHPEGLGDAPPEPPAKKKRGRPSYKSLLLNLDKNTLRPKSVAGK
jgi:TPR repeat protein